MLSETLQSSIDFAARSARSGGKCGIIFFGGEPLLQRELIYQAADYAEFRAKRSNTKFHYKITTNGLLLDDEFLRFSQEKEVFIALSHDGVREAHDKTRVDCEGKGTFDRLSDKIDALLAQRPYAPVMMTVDPSNVEHYYAGVEYLYNKGFRYLICSMNYAGDWDKKALAELKRQYKALADFYERLTRAEEKFYFSPFEVKLASHIRGDAYCHERCELGKKQLSVAPDGTLYPCVQFVGDEKYAIGDVFIGIDQEARLRLYNENELEKPSCAKCAIRKRCNHYCGCLNKQVTGSINAVAPSLCAHERIVLPIADALGERLFKDRNAMFIQKQYNGYYPLLSLLDDSV